jgi:hypothetical protein
MAATAAQGLTFGLADELAGMVGGPGATQRMREDVAAFRGQNPYAAMGLEVAGAIPTGIGIGAGLGKLAQLGGRAGQAGKFLSAPAMLPQATIGAAEGATYGAGTGETPGQRLTGGLVGTGLGALGGLVSAPIAGAITRRFAPGMQAENILRTNIGRDIGRQPTPTDYQAMAATAGARPELTMAEIPGRTTQGLARTMTAQPGGAGMEKAATVLNERARGSIGRLVTSLRELTGAQGDYYGNLARLGQQRAEEAAPLYQLAYDAPFEVSDEIIDTLDKLGGAGWLRPAYNKARTLAYAEDKTKLPTWAEFSKQVDEAEGYDLETFDWIKQGLDAQYDQLVRKSPKEAGALLRLKKELVTELDEAVPAYSAARKAWGGPSAQMEAQEAGKNILKEDAGLTEDAMQRMSDAEREAYVLGATEAISQRMRSRPRRMGGAPSIPEYVEDRMRFAFPTDDAFQDFLSTVDAEVDMQGFKNSLMARSPTADILTGQEDALRLGGLGSVAQEAISGNLGAAGANLMRQLRPPQRNIAERIADPLTSMLMTQGMGIPPVLQRLQKPAIMPRLLAPGLTAGMATATGQLGRGENPDDELMMLRRSLPEGARIIGVQP